MVPTTKMAGHERRSGLDEAAREQRALTPGVAAIALAKLCVFLRQVERLASLLASDQLEREPIKAIQGVELAAAIGLFTNLIELLNETAAVLQSGERELVRQAEV